MGVPRTKQSSTLRYSRLLSFISITVTLFMLGALGLVYVLEQGLSHEVRERVAFTIELPSQEQTKTSKLTQELRSLPYVRDVELITPDSAARSLAEVLGEDPTKVLGYNPLQPMAKIYLRAEYTHPDSLRKITASNPLLKTAEGLQEQEGEWASASRNLQTIRLVLWIFLGLHLLVSFLQINTATGLIIYSQRMRIRTLSLIGATASFIAWPFIQRAMLDALVGALIALGLLAGAIFGVYRGLGFDLLAVLVSLISSWRATRKYIHMDEGKIHLI